MSLLDPLTHALAAVLAAAHTLTTAIGLAPDSGVGWLLCLLALVALVRLLLVPFAVHGVRQAHAAARARSDLLALAHRYRNRTDADSVRARLEERRTIHAEHGVSRWGCLPLLAQVPIWWALYHLVSTVAAGASVGAMGAQTVATLAAASLLGVPLISRGYAGSLIHVAVVVGLAVGAAALSFVTQRWFVAPNTVLSDAPDALVSAQQMLPLLSAVGLLVAGAFVPVALLLYWVCNGAWTLGQAAAIARWAPTPGSAAALAAATRTLGTPRGGRFNRRRR
ncbi:MAG: membrane protein insertase YidC [Nocardioides sp.]|uniref:membrane protein insertase YidC n=1 Tax=Nocardioides sp. TaxID=35761 RepID=UPI000C97D905|nr:membrane protein insertase YidC [Nocardioides sp.]MAS54797.1 hypothetical protein [Pimelobacter sp.]MDE0778631.1 membrane protein insertase YidC [Nocardioides sp.]